MPLRLGQAPGHLVVAVFENLDTENTILVICKINVTLKLSQTVNLQLLCKPRIVTHPLYHLLIQPVVLASFVIAS